MATAEIDTHAHGDHDHPPFLAHHFDTPEQQYDSGKLGMWLFLITEILFFSGLFCAYAIYRSLRPEVYTFCSQFLNTELGAINTAVLLFSSLTMAWAVRASQLEQHKTTMWMIAITIGCAMIFLGVKAVEYTHKWDIGLLPAGFYHYQPDAPHPEGISDWLIKLSIIPGIIVVGMIGLLGYSIAAGKEFLTKISVPLTLAAICYFAGVGLGMFLESGGDHGSDHAAAVAGEHHDDGDHHDHAADSEHEDESHAAEHTAAEHLAETEISSNSESCR